MLLFTFSRVNYDLIHIFGPWIFFILGLMYDVSIHYYTQCTKQIFSERFGRGSRTVDLELEAQIDVLRDTKSKYESILTLATALITHFQSMVQTQQALGDTFTDLSQKSPELQVP